MWKPIELTIMGATTRMMNSRTEKIYGALDALGDALDLGRSESSTERPFLIRAMAFNEDNAEEFINGEEGLYCPFSPEAEPPADAAEIEKMRMTANAKWIPEIDAQLVQDLHTYVLKTGNTWGLLALALKVSLHA
jgi:hypothetical protein